MPKALRSCPKSNKSPNLVTLLGHPIRVLYFRVAYRCNAKSAAGLSVKCFWKSWSISGLFLINFWSFQANMTYFYNKLMWKSGIGFEPTTSWTWVSLHYQYVSVQSCKRPTFVMYVFRVVNIRILLVSTTLES